MNSTSGSIQFYCQVTSQPLYLDYFIFPLPEKTADILRCHPRFPWEMTFEKQLVQKFNTDDMSLPISASDWSCCKGSTLASTNQKHYPDVGRELSSDLTYQGKPVVALQNGGCFLRLVLSGPCIWGTIFLTIMKKINADERTARQIILFW